MTGFKSKKTAALDEDGMYLVHQTAQPAQESVGFVDSKLNPIQRPWVGLTDEEVDQFHNWKDCTWSTNELVRHVEAKLREKNT